MNSMMRDRQTRAARILLIAVSFATGCTSLNYDDPGRVPSPGSTSAATPSTLAVDTATPPANAVSVKTEDAATPKQATARRETPTHARLSRRASDEPVEETARNWRELARLARENAQSGKLDEANELLAQAALQLKDRRPTNTQRRTVFGLRARLAHDLAALGHTEQADALTNQLLEEVRAEPDLADTALVTLARATAERRAAAAKEAGREESQLPLLSLAFNASQSRTASSERLGLAFEVSGMALREGDLELARRAIDQAIFDAQIVAPADRMQAAALKVYKSRIALAQRDLETAEAAAHAAVRIFEQQNADGSNRGVAEATLGQILAEKGELERALEVGRGAYARLSGSETIVSHARRQIPACLGRIEWLAGEPDMASSHYREALSVSSDGSQVDADLVRQIKAALAELETSASAAVAP